MPFLRAARLLLASAALGLSPTLVGAETLPDALVKAYQTSPLLDSNRAALRALDENIPQARASRRPQVSATGSAQGQTDVQEFPFDNQYVAALEASLLLFDNGQSKAAIESARNSVAAGRASLLNVEQQVLFAAVTAYMDVLQALAFVEIVQNEVAVLTEQLAATRNRFEVGEVTRTDIAQTEARLAGSNANLVTATGNLEVARQAYLAAVGTLPENLAPAPPIPQLPGSVAEAEQLAIQQNPLIVAARFAERVAVYDFDRARAASGLSIQAGVSVDYTGQQFSPAPNTGRIYEDGFNLGASVGANLPLYTGGRNSSLIRQAQQILDQRRFEVQDTARQVVEQVNNAWTQLEAARASIVANQEQVAAAELAFQGVSEEARLGARSTLDVLDADQERQVARGELVRSRRNEYVAAYAVLQAAGLLTVRHLGLGIETYDPDVYFSQVQSAPVGGYDTSAVDRIRARWEKP
jgi:outer membrane protein